MMKGRDQIAGNYWVNEDGLDTDFEDAVDKAIVKGNAPERFEHASD